MSGIFQTEEWTNFKVKTGYEKFANISGIFVLQKKLPFGRSMLYSPMVGEHELAGITNQESEIKNEFFEKIQELSEQNNTIFYRLELDIPVHNSKFILPNSFKKAFEEMQPEHTLVLDISKSEEEILSDMKPKGRYNIKVAEKNGVTVREDREINNFYKLYSTMAKRQRITFRAKQYYQELFDNLGTKGYVKVLTAYTKESVPVASAIISFYEKRATYLFGGSSDEYRNLMAPYAVQWNAIKEAKRQNCQEYDFYGIAPLDSVNHPWAGVTRFKKQFGGQEIEIMGSYDLIFKPIEYKLFKLAEKIRRK